MKLIKLTSHKDFKLGTLYLVDFDADTRDFQTKENQIYEWDGHTLVRTQKALNKYTFEMRSYMNQNGFRLGGSAGVLLNKTREIVFDSAYVLRRKLQ